MARMNGLQRLYRHLWGGEREARRLFSPQVLSEVEAHVAASERQHRGELRVVIEGGLGWAGARGVDARARALAVFGQTGVWDTQENSGVLIYLLMAEHRLEVLADRGIDAHVPADAWQRLVSDATGHFRAGRGEAGLVQLIDAITALLATHFPAGDRNNPDELGNRPLVL
ncbi:TPM domain-containing protein [Uliginosibacterium sp. H1]|uniref:TPM domain-containing protein n=1 Tax=Uliginosibacterium sp. H1 TaxID=3114757 RepID=UPI002E18611A|nr:TPM domain-containing protein [Uliginosibacterium sp. H1]